MQKSMLLPTFVLLLASAASAQEVTLYSTDFTDLTGWTPSSACGGAYTWAADATPASHPAGAFVSAPASLNFNNGVDVGGVGSHGGAFVSCGKVTSDPIDLSAAVGTPRLRFMASWEFEPGCDWDVLSLRVLSVASGAALFEVPCFETNEYLVPWTAFDFALERSWGEVKVEFEFQALDDWNNEGTGAFIDDLSVVDVLPLYAVFCAGDGSATPCPCANNGGPGAGCANSTGVGATLAASGSASVGAGDLVLESSGTKPNQFGTYLQGTNSLNGGNGIVFGDGLRCAGGSLVRLQQVQSDASGSSSTTLDIAQIGNVSPGDTRYYQLWYRDPINSPCSSTFNLTNGIGITWLP